MNRMGTPFVGAFDTLPDTQSDLSAMALAYAQERPERAHVIAHQYARRIVENYAYFFQDCHILSRQQKKSLLRQAIARAPQIALSILQQDQTKETSSYWRFKQVYWEVQGRLLNGQMDSPFHYFERALVEAISRVWYAVDHLLHSRVPQYPQRLQAWTSSTWW